MAEEDKSQGLFRKAAQEKIASPEQLDKYIRVATPSVWVALAAVVIFFVGLAFWAFTGKIPTTMTANGIVRDNVIYCYLPSNEVSSIETGDTAKVLGLEGAEVISISVTPISSAEASRDISSDYAVSQLNLSDWNYVVIIRPSAEVLAKLTNGQTAQVSITTEESSPITFLLN